MAHLNHGIIRGVALVGVLVLAAAETVLGSKAAATDLSFRPVHARSLSAQPGQSSECDAVLQTTSTYDAADIYTKFAMLTLVNETNYEQAKHNLSTDATTPYGLFDGSYDDFKEKLATYLSIYKIDYEHSKSETHIAQYLPAAIAHDWLECKKKEFEQAGGFSIWVEKVSDAYVTLHFRWQPEGGFGGKALTNSINVIGSSSQHGDNLKKPWDANSERVVTFTRSAGKEFILNITVADRAKNVDVDPPIAGPAPTLAKIQLPCGSFTSNEYAHAHEEGQQDGVLDKDSNAVAVPFNYPKGTNADKVGAGLTLKGTCDAVPATEFYGFETIVLDEQFWGGGDDQHEGPCCWANAHWSPVWTSQINLPDNGSTKPYTLSIIFLNRIYQNVPLGSCTISVDGDPSSLPNNMTTKIPLSLKPGTHQLRLECVRDRTDVNWNENLQLSLKAVRG